MKKCNKHGISLRGWNMTYCPVCGDETVNISLCPFKFYINKGGLIVFSIASVACVLLVFFVKPSCEASAAKKAERLKYYAELESTMPPQWLSIYKVLQTLSFDDREDVMQAMNKKKQLNDLPPISGEHLNMFLDSFWSHDREYILSLLSKYVVGKP